MKHQFLVIPVLLSLLGCGGNETASTPAAAESTPAIPSDSVNLSPGRSPAPDMDIQDVDEKTIESWDAINYDNEKTETKKYIGKWYRFRYRTYGSFDENRNDNFTSGDILRPNDKEWSVTVEMSSVDEAKVAYGKKETVVEAELYEITPWNVVKSRFKNARVVSPR